MRRPRVKPVRISVAPPPPVRPRAISPLFLPFTFAVMIAVGTVLLLLPISNVREGSTPFVVALFTAASAVTVTGLTVVDTGTAWTPFGQVIIMLLIQVGGLGFMSFSTFMFILIGRRIGLRERLALRQAAAAPSVGGIVRLVRQVGIVVLVVEGLGFILFAIRFGFDFPIPTALWLSLFHTIASFNNAGFDIFAGESLELFQADLTVMLATAVLFIIGSIGFAVVADLREHRRFRRLSLDSKLVISVSVLLWAAGMIIFLFSEYTNNATLGPMTVPEKVLNAFFESASARTAGFASVTTASLSQGALSFLMGLMFIGGAAGSTAGGIKVNTFAVILASVLATIRGRPQVEIFKREIPDFQVSRALTIGLMGIGFIVVIVFGLTLLEGETQFVLLLFETVSAFATSGYSTGAPTGMSIAAQLLLTLTMFVGKVGPLTLMLALAQRPEAGRYRYAQERIRLG